MKNVCVRKTGRLRRTFRWPEKCGGEGEGGLEKRFHVAQILKTVAQIYTNFALNFGVVKNIIRETYETFTTDRIIFPTESHTVRNRAISPARIEFRRRTMFFRD